MVPGAKVLVLFHVFFCRNHGWHQVCTENKLLFFLSELYFKAQIQMILNEDVYIYIYLQLFLSYTYIWFNHKTMSTIFDHVYIYIHISSCDIFQPLSRWLIPKSWRPQKLRESPLIPETLIILRSWSCASENKWRCEWGAWPGYVNKDWIYAQSH